MRSTKASNAVTRLNERDRNYRYSLGMTGNGLFFLLRAAPGETAQRIGEDMALDEFVAFVKTLGPQKKERVTKHDAAFEKQLKRNG